MKHRLLVLNGQRLVQAEQGGLWNTTNVDKAGSIKPGIYNIYLAVIPDKSKQHEGVILYMDNASVYQQTGRNFIKHDRKDFDKIPEIGTNATVRYVTGKAQAAPTSIKQGRKIS